MLMMLPVRVIDKMPSDRHEKPPFKLLLSIAQVTLQTI